MQHSLGASSSIVAGRLPVCCVHRCWKSLAPTLLSFCSGLFIGLRYMLSDGCRHLPAFRMAITREDGMRSLLAHAFQHALQLLLYQHCMTYESAYENRSNLHGADCATSAILHMVASSQGVPVLALLAGDSRAQSLTPTQPSVTLNLWCMDPGVAFEDMAVYCRAVLLMSGYETRSVIASTSSWPPNACQL